MIKKVFDDKIFNFSIDSIMNNKYLFKDYSHFNEKFGNFIYKKIDLLEKTEIETKKFNTKNEEFYPYTFAALFSFLLSFLLQITYFRQIT